MLPGLFMRRFRGVWAGPAAFTSARILRSIHLSGDRAKRGGGATGGGTMAIGAAGAELMEQRQPVPPASATGQPEFSTIFGADAGATVAPRV